MLDHSHWCHMETRNKMPWNQCRIKRKTTDRLLHAHIQTNCSELTQFRLKITMNLKIGNTQVLRASECIHSRINKRCTQRVVMEVKDCTTLRNSRIAEQRSVQRLAAILSDLPFPIKIKEPILNQLHCFGGQMIAGTRTSSKNKIITIIAT